MKIEDTLTRASGALDKNSIRYALIGGFALAAHRIVRATVDIDLLVDGTDKALVKSSLEQAGFRVDCETTEVLHLSGPGQLDILFANRHHSQQMLARAKPINNFPVPVVDAEDLIGLKIQAYKNAPEREFQDKADIQSLMKTCKGLDQNRIDEYARIFDELEFIQSLRTMP
ncbi:MAG: hypothetical protein H6624_09470 [Bdellovibrionaceae bacterium]|nr:hypothetical protein [Bdellovibrionales bacterium]MCB9084564.1 hypothetical protein [Pseudobdellovibrionaceae bacterium]